MCYRDGNDEPVNFSYVVQSHHGQECEPMATAQQQTVSISANRFEEVVVVVVVVVVRHAMTDRKPKLNPKTLGRALQRSR